MTVTRMGFTRHEVTIAAAAGGSVAVHARIQPADIGFFKVRGESVDGAVVRLDGRLVCPSAPCEFEAPGGRHRLRVVQPGHAIYDRALVVRRGMESTITLTLVPEAEGRGSSSMMETRDLELESVGRR